MEPGWKQVREPPSHEDNFRSIAEFTPRGTVNRMVDVGYDKETTGGDAGKYKVRIIVWSGVSVDAVEEAVQEDARAGARVRQNVCISDDLTTEWRNPPAGGKMESLKRLLIQSLRERAKTSGYDQTRWIAVDSRYYSAWPNTSWGNLVSTIPGGSCGAAMHREILALAP